MNWYFEIDRKQQGPVSASHLVSAHQSGVLPESALVWNETLTDWEPLSRHLSALQAELQGAGDRSTEALATQRMAVCAFSGKVMPQADMIAYGDKWIAPEHKDAFVHGLLEGSNLDPRTTGDYVYAGFWIRFLAKFIDGIVLTFAGAVVQVPVAFFIGATESDNIAIQLVPMLFSQAVGFLYGTLMLWKYQATLGKMALSLKVISTDSPKLSYAKCVGRFFAEWLSTMILCIGYIIAAFDEEKRTLHDHICGTRVVKK